MDSSNPPPSQPAGIDALLAHRGLVHRIAAALVGGDGAADDVVQETWVAALRSGPREETSLRPWLARVAERFGLAQLRRDRARRRREATAVRDDAVPSPADVAAEEETRRRVLTALLSLDPESRDALLLRFYDDLPPREVAARLGVPVETARSRIRRGLERLRRRLQGDGDLRRLAVFLPPAVPRRAGPAAPLAAAGGLVVSKTAVGIAAGVLLLLVGGWMVSRPGDDSAGPAGGAAPEPAKAVLTGNAPPKTAPAADERKPAGDSPAAEHAATWRAVGRVTSSKDERGLPGGVVTVTLERGRRKDVIATVRTDAEGRFDVPLPALARLSESARAVVAVSADAKVAGHHLRGMTPSFARDLRGAPRAIPVEIQLFPGPTIRGRAVDARGRGVADAHVAGYGKAEMASARTDDEGRYELAVPETGPGFVTAWAPGTGTGALLDRTWSEDGDVDLPDLVLRGDGVIAGRVTRKDGEPVRGLEMWVSLVENVSAGAQQLARATPGNDDDMFTTDAEGRFRVTGLRPGKAEVRVSHAIEGTAGIQVACRTGDEDVRVVLGARIVRARLLGDGGEALLGAQVTVRTSPAGPSRGQTLDAGDEIAVFAVPQAADVVVHALVPGAAPIESAVLTPAGGKDVEVTLRLPPPPKAHRLAFRFPGAPDANLTAGILSLVTVPNGLAVPSVGNAGATRSAVDVPSGTYRAVVVPLGADEDEVTSWWLPVETTFTVGDEPETTVPVETKKGGRARVTFDAPATLGYIGVERAEWISEDDRERVAVDGWARIKPDGEEWGSPGFGFFAGPPMTIQTLRPYPPGRRRLRLVVQKCAPVEAVVVLESGAFTDVRVTLVLEPK